MRMCQTALLGTTEKEILLSMTLASTQTDSVRMDLVDWMTLILECCYDGMWGFSITPTNKGVRINYRNELTHPTLYHRLLILELACNKSVFIY